jgi:microcompartment protein CcmL/EutN
LKTGENHALGIIETEGRAPLIEAIDSAIKAASVTLKSSYFVGGGVNTVTLVGDVGAMRAALDAAKATIDRMGAVGQTHLIPRLAEDVWPLVLDQTNGRDPPRKPPEPEKPKGPEKPKEPEIKPVAELPAQEETPSAGAPEAGADALSVEEPVREEAGTQAEEPLSKAGEEAFFAGETPRAGQKASAPKKKSGGSYPGRKPRNGYPKPKG